MKGVRSFLERCRVFQHIVSQFVWVKVLNHKLWKNHPKEFESFADKERGVMKPVREELDSSLQRPLTYRKGLFTLHFDANNVRLGYTHVQK